jgi:hypothetical protein
MPIVQTLPINKRALQVVFNSGLIFGISIDSMFEVGIYDKERRVGGMKFSALSSLNNLSLRPLYNLDKCSVESEFDAYASDLYIAAIGHFQEYTNGRIQLPCAL